MVPRSLPRLVLLMVAACGPVELEEIEEGETTTDIADGGALVAGADETAGESSTGASSTCPQGQARWSALHSGPLSPPAGVVPRLRSGAQVALADGALAFAAMVDEQAAGLLLVSPTGDVLDVSVGPTGDARLDGLARRAEGGLVMLGIGEVGGGLRSFLTRFTADGRVIGRVSFTPNLLINGALAVSGDAAVILGEDRRTSDRTLMKVDIPTGKVLWSRVLAEFGAASIEDVVVGPRGHVVVSADVEVSDGVSSRVRLWRFDGDGGLVWDRTFEQPVGALNGLAVTPADEVVALRLGPFGDSTVGLFAVEPDRGELRWWSVVAQGEPGRKIYAGDVLVDGDGLTVPVARSAQGKVRRESVELRRLAFTGEAIETVELAELPPGPDDFRLLSSFRGGCGELVIVAGESVPWLAVLAP